MRNEYPKLTDAGIGCIKASPDNQRLYIADSMGYVQKFSISAKGFCQKLGYLHNDMIYAIAFTDDGKYFFTSDGEGICKQHDAKTNELVKN